MTPAQVKQILARNKKAGRWPSSLYQISQKRKCARSLLTKVMADPMTQDGQPRPAWVYIVASVTNHVR